SLYSNKEIFLRELIANSADAIDKARFEALTNADGARDWEIRLTPNKNDNTLTISDNGTGMTKEEVVANIGTIAKSGTKAFVEALEKSKEENSPELIGQFGVGFYSAFMVADKVELVAKKAGSDEPAVRWSSTGKSSYSLEEAGRDEQGTEITLHLKEDEKAYLEEWKLREIVKKYSDYIEHPVKMSVTKKKDDESEETTDEILNSQKAIWLRPAKDVTEDEHKNFFSQLEHLGGEPLYTIHYAAEGTSEFKALLYLPSKAPFDLFTPEQRKQSLHLYIKRVFITDDCKGLLPDYLRFVKGVVDSSDLPLNISRETLQDNPAIMKISKNLVRKILSELAKMMENDSEKYLGFYKEFGRTLKEGVHTDFANKEKLQDLLLFETMNGESEKLMSLKEYVSAMPEKQKDIYYLTGEDRKVLEDSPLLETVRKNGSDVIFMIDPIDEWVVQSLTEYDGKKLKSLAKGDVELDDDSAKETEKKLKKAEKEHKKLIEFLKKELEDKVKDVRFSKRLTDSACCLVGDEHDPSPNMERIFRAMNQEMPGTKRILELNSEHSLVNGMQKLYDASKDDPRLADFASLLYDQALLLEGASIPDPMSFSKKISELMV
ncbi:MAG: molecular chaperone HtpG, partial [Victivallales bacterium]|nr:molecular chaperone HtpG [Victivallales bacterium]